MADSAAWLRRVGCALALAIALAPAGPAFAADPPAWPEESWNPQPLADDLVLPLPCGGAIAWRPVPTPLGRGPLADRPVLFGQADPETDHAEYLRQGFVAGPFPGPDGAPPRFYLAKYEVSRDQWSAVMAETCPTLPSQGGRVAQGGVSWFDAVAFGARLSEFLLKTAPDRLPGRDGARGFVRLPTEEEWEYAARGGATVDEAAFGGRLPPMEGGLQRHAWFQGPRSAAGQVRPIGARAPNPLGLHDIFGNVAEWSAEPFRLVRIGRPHGLPGGGVVRGGDFLTPESALRASLRVELPLFDGATGAPLRLRQVGLRPALGLVVLTADARVPELRAAFAAETASRGDAAADPARLLEVLRAETADPALRRGLERVVATLQAERRARSEQEQAALRSQIEAAAALARQVLIADGNRMIFQVAGDTVARIEQPLAARVAALLRGRPAEIDRALAPLLASYLRVIQRVERGADAARIADQARIVVEELRAQNLAALADLAALAARHMTATAAGTLPAPDQVRADILATLTPTPAPPGGQTPPRR